MSSKTIRIQANPDAVARSTAIAAHRAAGRTYRAIVGGERAEPIARDAGTYYRTVVAGARRDAIATLDAVTGRPGRRASREERVAWYLAADLAASDETGEAGE